MKALASILSAVVVVCSLPSCDSSAGEAAKSWVGISSATETVIELIHEGTGWLLRKHQVEIERTGEVMTEGGDYVSQFEITVTNGDSTFATTISDVPCDKIGIPTKESVSKLQKAVEDIKKKIKDIQQ